MLFKKKGVAYAKLEFGATKMGNTNSNLRRRWCGGDGLGGGEKKG